MTSLVEFNAKKMAEILGREVADITVLVAKNMILGNTPEGMAAALGASEVEIHEILATQDYKDCHLVMATHYSAESIETDLGYDSLEQKALAGLMKRVDKIQDPDQLLRIASMANKATRRHQTRREDALDPGRSEKRVALTLTTRMVEQLQTGNRAIEQTKEISIKGGHVNPTFDQVNEFFGVNKAPRIEENYRIESEPDVSMAALEQLLRDGK